MVRRYVRVSTRFVVLMSVAAAMIVVPRIEAMAEVTVVPTRAAEVAGPVRGEAMFALPFAAQHIALHWFGHPDAPLWVARSTDGLRFDTATAVARDEVGEGHPSGETYGAVMAAEGATHVRVSSDRPIGRVTVLAMADGEAKTVTRQVAADQLDAAETAQPAVISRSGWNADESLRFRANREIWPAAFYRVQKLIVHHTATSNTYVDIEAAKAEIRAVYYYHAVTQGWGDIGYNFIVDRFGNVYEGRFARSYTNVETPTSVETPTGEDTAGRVVTAGHTFEHNVGTVGIAMLGTFTGSAPSSEAQAAIVGVLTWEASRHSLDPTKIARYRNVVNGIVNDVQPNIASHRNFNATACPGEAYYTLLNSGGLRDRVKTALGATWVGDSVAPPPPGAPTPAGARRKITLTWGASKEPWEPAMLQSGVAYYEILRAASPLPPQTVIGSSGEQTLTFTDSVVRGTYNYAIVAVDAAGNRSQASPIRTGTAS